MRLRASPLQPAASRKGGDSFRPTRKKESPMLRFLLPALLLIPLAHARDLEIYWIDVEGGASTLIISPSGESMLIDTGWTQDGRDALEMWGLAV